MNYDRSDEIFYFGFFTRLVCVEIFGIFKVVFFENFGIISQ